MSNNNDFTNPSERAPYLEIGDSNINISDSQKELRQIITNEHALAFQAIPLSLDKNILNVAIVEHKNTKILKQLKKISGYEIEATPLTPEMFAEFYKSLYEEDKIATSTPPEIFFTAQERNRKSDISRFFSWQFIVLVLATLFLFLFDVFFKHPIFWVLTILIWIFIWYNLRNR